MTDDELTRLIIDYLEARLRDSPNPSHGRPDGGYTSRVEAYNDAGEPVPRPDDLQVDGYLDCRELARVINGSAKLEDLVR